ncbi:methyltransferase domain-containing protein [Streptomyces sp. NPDC006923]|uniref:class I SAM-dependent methyltransferase n=1 Tax=Streptomyces sp. NPDC006923 TaxID=3155355 RepID=UPI00340B8291
MATTTVNQDQSDAWNGYEGRHWADHAERYDALNEGADELLLDAAGVRAGLRILDIGCGTGQLTRRAALRGAEGLGLDLSAPMLEAAADTAAKAGLESVSFVRGDAQVFPFDEAAYDAAVSRFGVMFFADPVAAFANIRRALRPGGRLAFVCSQGHAQMDQTVIYRAIGARIPVPDFTQHTGPASFADPARSQQVLSEAGFTSVTVEPFTLAQHWGADPDDAAGFLTDWGPVRHWMREAHADDAVRRQVRAAAAEAFAAYTTDDGVTLSARVWRVSADRP